MSLPLLPRNVEVNSALPAELSLLRNASWPLVGLKTAGRGGKAVGDKNVASASMVIPSPASTPAPPRKLLKMRLFPSAASFVTKASGPAPNVRLEGCRHQDGHHRGGTGRRPLCGGQDGSHRQRHLRQRYHLLHAHAER